MSKANKIFQFDKSEITGVDADPHLYPLMSLSVEHFHRFNHSQAHLHTTERMIFLFDDTKNFKFAFSSARECNLHGR